MNSPTGNSLKEWIGRSETVSDVVTPTPLMSAFKD
jgi:3-methylfumaryl-CoA hydratase